MESKIILVTGATDGIGKITATSLAKQGNLVIVHGRNKQKAEKVRDEIISQTGNKKVDILIADLLSLADVKRAVEEFTKKYPRLDVLINNAGAMFGKNNEVTKEGYEKTFVLNTLSPMLLMLLLEPSLTQSPSARIINMYSAMHKRGGKPDFNDFQLEKSYKPDRAYGLSKLYLIWLMRYFAKNLKEKGINNITVNGTHPGAVATNFGQEPDKGFIINIIFKIALWFMPKPEEGAKSSIYLATSTEVENVTGEFFGPKSNREKPDDKYYSIHNEKVVWDYCMSIIRPYLPPQVAASRL